MAAASGQFERVTLAQGLPRARHAGNAALGSQRGVSPSSTSALFQMQGKFLDISIVEKARERHGKIRDGLGGEIQVRDRFNKRIQRIKNQLPICSFAESGSLNTDIPSYLQGIVSCCYHGHWKPWIAVNPTRSVSQKSLLPLCKCLGFACCLVFSPPTHFL